MKKKIIACKSNLIEVEYGIRNKGTDNAYFSVTGLFMEKVSKNKVSKNSVRDDDDDYRLIDGRHYYISVAGCIHDEIKQATNEFDDIIKLHLSDIDGTPMHAFANGFYHIKNGFINTPTNSEDFKDKFCDYYRIPQDLFDELSNVVNDVQYSKVLLENGVLYKWEEEAKQVIEKYEL